MKRVVVLDYGSGNLRSAQRALERVGAEVTVTADPRAAVEAEGLVVPGVGAFAACMAGPARDRRRPRPWPQRLAGGRPRARHLRRHAGAVRRRRRARRRDGRARGAARAGRAAARAGRCRTWAGTPSTVSAGSKLFAGLDAGTRFYFVHSYAAHHTSGAGVAIACTASRSSPRSRTGWSAPRSSTPRSPATPARSCSRTG